MTRSKDNYANYKWANRSEPKQKDPQKQEEKRKLKSFDVPAIYRVWWSTLEKNEKIEIIDSYEYLKNSKIVMSIDPILPSSQTYWFNMGAGAAICDKAQLQREDARDKFIYLDKCSKHWKGDLTKIREIKLNRMLESIK